MNNRPRVILIAGPAGSGKSTTAARIGEHAEWVHVSEDAHWEKVKEGHPKGEFRTAGEQEIVQAEVLSQIMKLISDNKHVALELIIYEDPPLPLLKYQQALDGANIPYMTKVLRPTVDEILSRIEKRGRDSHVSQDALRGFAEHQISCLHSPHIHADWIIDSTGIPAEEVYQKYFRNVVEGEIA